MNKFTKALLLALVVSAPVATFAPTVQAKQVMSQQKVAQATTSPTKPKKHSTTRKKPTTKPTSSMTKPSTSASPTSSPSSSASPSPSTSASPKSSTNK